METAVQAAPEKRWFYESEGQRKGGVPEAEIIALIKCRIPSDHIPIRSWPLFLARELMRDLIETLKAEQST